MIINLRIEILILIIFVSILLFSHLLCSCSTFPARVAAFEAFENVTNSSSNDNQNNNQSDNQINGADKINKAAEYFFKFLFDFLSKLNEKKQYMPEVKVINPEYAYPNTRFQQPNTTPILYQSIATPPAPLVFQSPIYPQQMTTSPLLFQSPTPQPIPMQQSMLPQPTSTPQSLSTQPTSTPQSMSSQPTSTPPMSTQPTAIQPVTSQPTSTPPISSQPTAIQPVTSQPTSTPPISSQPALIQPATPQSMTTPPPVLPQSMTTPPPVLPQSMTTPPSVLPQSMTTPPSVLPQSMTTPPPVLPIPTDQSQVTSQPTPIQPVTSQPTATPSISSQPATVPSGPSTLSPTDQVKQLNAIQQNTVTQLNNIAANLKKEGFTGANTNYGMSSQYKLYDNTPVDTSSWFTKDLTSTHSQHSGLAQILNRPKQQVPLPPDELLMFANTSFKPECCPNTYSNSTGCACMTIKQNNYLIERGGNNVPYSEY